MKNIIVASDLSERSRPAVRRAVSLATAADAKLTVVHVVDDAIPDSLSQQVRIGAKSILSDQVTADAEGKSLSCEIQVVIGDVMEEIDRIILNSYADLLIVGQHRRRKFLDQIRETTMEHLVRSSRIPVLLVTNQADNAYANVLGGVDLSSVCAIALNKVAMVAPNCNLSLFHAHEVSFRKEAERDYEIWKAVHPLPDDLPQPKFFEATAVDALSDITKHDSYDLLAIGGHTRSNAGRFFLGGFTAGLIRNPPCDLLIAK